ncbi:hypothetical protein [Chromobacterium violaceum]|nr:hypothetical protein [Chromobacterium violaceum]
MQGDSSPSKRLEQAWQDYRRWQDGHPARHSAGGAVGRGIDAYA